VTVRLNHEVSSASRIRAFGFPIRVPEPAARSSPW
jgi:hypothetical protein